MAWRAASRLGFIWQTAARPEIVLRRGYATATRQAFPEGMLRRGYATATRPTLRYPRHLLLGSGATAFGLGAYVQSLPTKLVYAEELPIHDLVSRPVLCPFECTDSKDNDGCKEESQLPEASDDAYEAALTEHTDDSGGGNDLHLVQLAQMKRGSRIAGFLTWSVTLFCWTSLVWLPLLTVSVVSSLIRNGPSQNVCTALAFLASLYTFPHLASPAGLDKHGLWSRWLLGWFESVELWAAQEAIQRQASEPTLVCYHPHGILCVGSSAIALGGKTLLHEGVDAFISPYINYFGPLMSILPNLSWSVPVRLHSVGKDSMHRVMKERRDSIFIVPGGIQEATLSKPGQELVFLQRRKGFVKYALQHGYSLTPVYAFGENDTYDNLQAGMKWRLKLNEGFLGQPQGIPTVCPFGWRWFPLLPKPSAQLRVVVGPPLRLPHIKSPSNKEVQHWHAVYVEEVKRLYAAGVKGQADARPLKVM